MSSKNCSKQTGNFRSFREFHIKHIKGCTTLKGCTNTDALNQILLRISILTCLPF